MHASAFLTTGPSKSDVARLKLLKAAIRIFGDKGIKGATVREIAKAAGQNVAAIAYYFGNKENLYRAVMEGIVREIRHHLADVLEEISEMRQQKQGSGDDARRLLKMFLRTFYLRVLSRNEAVAIGRLIVREQTQPSAAFEILYENAFRELHETLCYLVGTVVGWNPRERETIIRTHALMGQVWFFAVSRETILRRLGWSDLEGKNAELVAEILAENVDVLLTGLLAKTREKGQVIL